ncbi:Complement C1q-like protein 2 [Mactra antiquata]
MKQSVVILLCLFAVIGAIHSVEDNDFNKMVLRKLDELNDKVVELQQENQALKHHIQRSTAKRQALESFFPATEVGFSARVSQHVKNLTAHQPIKFGNVITNIGNYYNPTSGMFFVPVTGTYLFYVNILSEANNNIETELVQDGSSLAEIYSGAGKFHGAGSNFVIANVTKGKNVWVKVHAAYSTDMSVHCCWSTFSGYLLREYETPASIVG